MAEEKWEILEFGWDIGLVFRKYEGFDTITQDYQDMLNHIQFLLAEHIGQIPIKVSQALQPARLFVVFIRSQRYSCAQRRYLIIAYTLLLQ
jgi:hypothetical protein